MHNTFFLTHSGVEFYYKNIQRALIWQVFSWMSRDMGSEKTKQNREVGPGLHSAIDHWCKYKHEFHLGQWGWDIWSSSCCLSQTLYNFLSCSFEVHLSYGLFLIAPFLLLYFQNSIVMASSNISLKDSRTLPSCFRG